MLDYRRELEESCQMTSVIYQLGPDKTNSSTENTISLVVCISIEHTEKIIDSPMTRKHWHNYYSQCNKVNNVLPSDPNDMMQAA